MKRLNPYLALIPIIDQALFGFGNVEEYFKTNDKLIFSNFFINYQAQFQADPTEHQHDWLLIVLFEYCQAASSAERKAIVDVVLDNELIVQHIIFITSLRDGRRLSVDQCSINFHSGLKKFLDGGNLTPEMGGFFLYHFRNFEDINVKEGMTAEFNKSDYKKLISRYLKRQTDFSFTN